MPLPHVSVNDQPLFDSFSHTTGGGLPTLMEVVQQAFEDHLKSRLEALAAEGHKTVTFEQAKRKATLAMFLTFAGRYLAEHRVVETFAVDANVGLVLSNQVRCVACPGLDIAGTMQDSDAVGVTQGVSQPHLQGVVPTKSMGVR